MATKDVDIAFAHVDTYAQRKNYAKGLVDLSLLTSNAHQLWDKAWLDTQSMLRVILQLLEWVIKEQIWFVSRQVNQPKMT